MKEYHNRSAYNIKIDDVDGNPVELAAKIITPAMARQLEAAGKKENMATKVIEQMIIIFGKDKEFYEKFDIFLMNDVLTDIVNEIVLKKNK
jgi:hypothetical protein